MQVSEVARAETRDVAPDATFAELRTLLGEPGTDGVLVSDGGRLGVITRHDLLRSHVRDGGSAADLAGPVPAIDRSATVRDAARLLVRNRTPIAPVFDGGERWGTLTRGRVLAATADHLDALTVGDVHSAAVVTVAPDATVGEAVDALREHDLGRLPVVTRDNRPVGIVTTSDVLGAVARVDGPASDPFPRSLGRPVSTVMSERVETVAPDASLGGAVATMLRTDYGGLVVVPEESDRVAGVVTETDALEALPRTSGDTVDLEVVNAELLRSTGRVDIESRLASLTDLDGKPAVHRAHVRLQRLDRPTRGHTRVLCDVRVWTDDDRLAVAAEGNGADNALRLAVFELESRLREGSCDPGVADVAERAAETSFDGRGPPE